MRGTVRKISMPRRLVADLMRASIRVPFVSLARPLNVRSLTEARALAAQPPGWAAIFVKAFALVAKDEPVLRTLYAKWPWPGFYELPRSIAMVAIARVEDGQDCVLPQKVPSADELPLSEIDAQIRQAKDAPVDQVPAFRKILAGDAAAAAAAPADVADRPEFRTPARQLVREFWGDLGGRLRGWRAACAEPGAVYAQLWRRGADQTISVVIRWDHRITDAALIAKALTRLEQVLNTEIAAELRGQRQQTEPSRSGPSRPDAE